ncbi:unnamed protein product [Schistocephalus solidus]|uniref:Uncharacterized protein n=1 Tax=Schistocephalus solidus TaxID=70667 RepID=A0A183SXF1_SCHSO|nr:unnamed protein product [Schistocephalus solidus]
MIRKTEEIQGYADCNEMKNFFKDIKAIFGQCMKGTALLLSSDGTLLLTEKSQILKRWAGHFRSVLNCSSTISDSASDWLPQLETNNDLDLPPSLPETIRAMQQIYSGKAPGSDANPTGSLQARWAPSDGRTHNTLPRDVASRTTSSGFQRLDHRPSLQTEMEPKFCDNHRGISLLNIAGKIFARILLNRLNGHLEQGLLPESQGVWTSLPQTAPISD